MTQSSTFSMSLHHSPEWLYNINSKISDINFIGSLNVFIMCYIFLDLQVPLALLVCLAHLVGLCSRSTIFWLDKVPSVSQMYCILFASAGPKGDRGYKGEQGDQGITVRTSESVSSSTSASEYFFIFYETCSISRPETTCCICGVTECPSSETM